MRTEIALMYTINILNIISQPQPTKDDGIRYLKTKGRFNSLEF